VIYRLYKPNDFAQLYAIEESCFQPPFRFGRRYMRQLIGSSHAATWIAEEDERMAGFAIVEWNEEQGEVIAYIQTIEVTQAERGRGIGGQLLARIEGSARVAGAALIWLHVDAENTGAIGLYRANSYLLEGREENYYAPGRAALIFAKPLACL
jgi:ribosomal-protein-alanine N-acetyltransferase